MSSASTPPLPYRLACLCDLRDAQGRILLLRRLKEPNKGLCSPIGGKLDMTTGESPAQCAVREIKEEAGIDVPVERLHLMALISERGFEAKGHWLLFFYRILGPVEVEPQDMREGRLEWFAPHELDALPLPETDRRIIWPLIKEHESPAALAKPGGLRSLYARPGFFTVHIDCTGQGGSDLAWRVEQSERP
jgi:8-oxo-dGTP diphosphatase